VQPVGGRLRLRLVDGACVVLRALPAQQRQAERAKVRLEDGARQLVAQPVDKRGVVHRLPRLLGGAHARGGARAQELDECVLVRAEA
jgi:hypothetical protein